MWRLKAADGGPSSYVSAFDDPRMLINISVWETIETLHQYAYRTLEHAAVFRDRRRWFEPSAEASLALWWVPAGELPTVEDAIARLEQLRRQGPTPAAFSFKVRFAAPERWQGRGHRNPEKTLPREPGGAGWGWKGSIPARFRIGEPP